MKDTAKKRFELKETTSQLAFAAMRDARTTLHEAIILAGMNVLHGMLEDDRVALCGPRYEHDATRRATRAGYTDGELPLGGRRMTVRKPRVRDQHGEVSLPTWEKFANEDPLTPRAVEQMILGVSTRNYERSPEPTPPGMKTRGTSKSAVSRKFVAATRESLEVMMNSDLSALPLCAVIIDGIHVSEHLVVTAIGIDESGDKHVLGLHEGATENETVCKTLLTNLIARGMRNDRTMLFVIDGSKALHAAIRKVFGARALIQRCQVHKRRNVEDHLPESMRKQVGNAMSTAYRCGNPKNAKRLLEALARQLEKKYPSAASSLREGLEETLTVMHFHVSKDLERTLATTNTIEFVNSRIRKTTHNVTKWNGGEMALRWIAAALVEAAKTFRKLRGFKTMPILVAALRAHDQITNPNPIDGSERAA